MSRALIGLATALLTLLCATLTLAASGNPPLASADPTSSLVEAGWLRATGAEISIL